MTTQSDSTQSQSSEESSSSTPDHVAVQYRVITLEEGSKTRRERIGVAWNTDKGICFRPAGAQVIEGDVYLYPFESDQPIK